MYLCRMKFILTILLVLSSLGAEAQTVEQELKANVNRAAGMFFARPIVGKLPKDTPAPNGKKAFYINHYGSTGSYYLSKKEYYEEPYAIFMKADSLGKLTKLGKDVLRRVTLLRNDAKDRWGELTEKGALQSRALMKILVDRVPEMFTKESYYSVHSIVENRSILTMQEGLLQLSSMQQPIIARSRASNSAVRYMLGGDSQLAAQATDSLTMVRYNRFVALNSNDGRLMASLFNDQNYVITNIDAAKLAKQLFILAGNIQHTELAGLVNLYDIFTP